MIKLICLLTKKGMQLLEAMSCGYEADPLSLVLNDHSISNDIYYLNVISCIN